MSKWFCATESGLDPAIKMAAYSAGYLIAKNNSTLTKTILPVAQGIKKQVDTGGDNAALNAILKEGLTELVPLVSPDPIIQAAVAGVLSSLNINVAATEALTLTNAIITELVDSFVNGMAAQQALVPAT